MIRRRVCHRSSSTVLTRTAGRPWGGYYEPIVLSESRLLITQWNRYGLRKEYDDDRIPGLVLLGAVVLLLVVVWNVLQSKRVDALAKRVEALEKK